MSSTTSIKDKVYKLVENSLTNSSTKSGYKKALTNFINKRTESLYDNIPCDRIVFGDTDITEYYKETKIDKNIITEAISNTYYGTIDNFNPAAAKDEFTVTQLCVIRYYHSKKLTKDLELAMIYLGFSGKFYPSLHYRSYNIPPNRNVMEYVVNNNLSGKFDLASEGSILGAVRSICNTWIKTYSDKFKRFDDEDVVYVIQQLHSRIGSFMKNIASEYYETYNSGKNVITYDSDSYEQDDYHLADSDSLKIQRVIEKANNKINSNGVDYRICKICSDENIRPNEVKSIIESIMGSSDNNIKIRELISLIVINYYTYYSGKDKDVRDISFITYSVSAKPNAKQKEITRQKELLEELLLDNSTAYARRRSRISTKNSYEKAILMYFVIVIHNSNRE